MFNVTVAAKFSTHAKIKYTELYLIGLLSLGLMYVKKFVSFCRVLKRCAQKKIGSFLLPHGASAMSPTRCITPVNPVLTPAAVR